MKHFLLLIILACLASSNTDAQPNQSGRGNLGWRAWGGISMDFELKKYIALSLNHLRSYDADSKFRNSFNQTSLSLDYDFTRDLTSKVGVMITQFPGSSNNTLRTYARLSNRSKIGESIRWWNGIQLEWHSMNENRFRYRMIYITRFALRHRIPFLKLSPSVSYLLYYNVGGSPIQYYDTEGNPSFKATPDGLHRGRFAFNLNSKINKMFSLSLYYLRQNEFNLFHTSKALNVVNPSTGKITRPFNNYQVAGITFSIQLNKTIKIFSNENTN
ncbi:MAG: DUF2490 domain-containing protein [Saprospiraceae bacterium]